ncbi:MAG: ATP-dependent metallopeptidase FtsH/Yme1/Tma family protein, partial [Algicola sp.]|nr:ATP-dependent metallopeptidase FtsH/Yme1/Tma family protein [Algicola sp.]
MSDMAKNLILWLVIAVVLMSVFQNFTPEDDIDARTSYSQFVKEIKQNQIRKVKIYPSGMIVGSSRNGEEFELMKPGYDEALLDDLLNHNVIVDGE